MLAAAQYLSAKSDTPRRSTPGRVSRKGPDCARLESGQLRPHQSQKFARGLKLRVSTRNAVIHDRRIRSCSLRRRAAQQDEPMKMNNKQFRFSREIVCYMPVRPDAPDLLRTPQLLSRSARIGQVAKQIVAAQQNCTTFTRSTDYPVSLLKPGTTFPPTPVWPRVPLAFAPPEIWIEKPVTGSLTLFKKPSRLMNRLKNSVAYFDYIRSRASLFGLGNKRKSKRQNSTRQGGRTSGCPLTRTASLIPDKTDASLNDRAVA
eukprot:scaffold160244_cov41-Prasinocladus_malaysianus.AAC.1